MIPTRRGRGLTGAVLAILVTTAAAAALAGPADGLPAPAAADTVRTNLWLTEALMAEMAATAAKTLPPAPATVRLQPGAKDPATVLFGTVAARVLGGRGYTMYEAMADTGAPLPVDAVFGYTVLGVELAYPDVDRTLGIWRRWVERDLAVTTLVNLTEAATGRVLLKERLVRSFSDRVPDGDFGKVNSPLYTFTSAETQESGWQRRIEEIVVLGALAGLVAVYFANTRD